jgi:DNA polymerase I-like protein with 3'-5' exonuclease and polymerase domains
MVQHCHKHGYIISPAEAKAFHGAYWDLFKGVKKFGKQLEREFERTGYIYNAFGFRLVPAAAYKSLNYFIQSGVSGLMNYINSKLFTLDAPCQYVALIHDEDLGQFNDEDAQIVVDFKDKVMEDVNVDLGWDVKVRTGWVTGKDFYGAK